MSAQLTPNTPPRYRGIVDRLMAVEMALGVLRLHLEDAREAVAQGGESIGEEIAKTKLARSLKACLDSVERATLEITGGGTMARPDCWDRMRNDWAQVAAQAAAKEPLAAQVAGAVDLSDLEGDGQP